MTDRQASLIGLLVSTPVVILSTILFIVFMILVLPDQAKKAEQYSSESGSPDTSFYYTASSLYQMAADYGSDGRQQYVEARYRFDIIWPLVYTLFLFSSVGKLSLTLFQPPSVWRYLPWVPVLGLTFDYAENLTVSVVMLRYPTPTPGIAELTGITTALKWLFVNGSFALLLLLILIGLIQAIKSRRANG